jgi:hypothetical protein
VQRNALVTVSLQTFMGAGFGREAPMVIFDYPLFLVGSDLTPVTQRIGEFVNMLTKWVPQTKTKGMVISEKPKVTGADYADALKNFQNMFLQKQWGDGMFMDMPTKAKVDWILTGTDRARTDLNGTNGKISPKGGILTMEVLATALAMAGGRPEYLPVLIAYFMQNTGETTSSAGSSHGLIVNGPIGTQIRMACKFGLLGPDPNHPANASIGRAIRFVFMNVGGCTAGLGSIAQFGESRHTGIIIAEDEPSMPATWDPFNTEFYAVKKGTNTTTVISPASVRAFTQRGNGNEPTPEIEAEEGLRRCANTFKQVGYRAAPPALVTANAFMLYPSSTCGVLDGIYGSKAKIKETIAKYCFAALGEYQDATEFLRLLADQKKTLSDMPAKSPLATATNIMLICAGGDHPSRAMCIPGSKAAKTAEIVLPKAWNDLLAQTVKDLGPMPEV